MTIKKVFCILLLCAVLALPIMGCAALLVPTVGTSGDGCDIFVSPEGHDGNEGSAVAPLQTIDAALKMLQQMNVPSEGATIWLYGGTYYLDSPISFTYRDSTPITIRAVSSDPPVISGAVAITDWTETQYLGRQVWMARLETDSLLAVYDSMGALPSARWPKSGTLAVAKVDASDAIHPTSKEQASFGNQSQFSAFYAKPSDITISLEGARLRMPHLWKDEITGIAGYVPDSGRIILNRRTSMTISAKDVYWFENVLGTPLSPGEWAFDATSRTLIYAPRATDDIWETTLYAGVLERLVTIENVNDIRFSGITFSRTGWSIPLRDREVDFPQAAYDADASIYVRDARNIVFDHCTFTDIGAGCIRFDYNVRDSAVTRCTFTNIGAHAVYIKGKNIRNDPQATTRITVANNSIAGFGRNFYNAAAVLIIHASDITVMHNEIHEGYYSAISGGWVWGAAQSATYGLKITNNLIYNIGQGMLSDMGGIYLLGTQTGTMVSDNIIYNVTARQYGGWGVYLDEGASGVLVERNLVYDCSAQGFHQNQGVYNIVRNNIFANNKSSQVGITDKDAKGTFLLESNILVGSEPFYFRAYGDENIVMGENLRYTKTSPFVDAKNGNYVLRDGLSLDSVGFTPWVYDAGIQAE